MNLLAIVLPIVFFLVCALIVAQGVQMFFFPQLIRFRFEQDGGGKAFQDQSIQALWQELQELGFTELGALSERPLFSPGVKSLTLASAQKCAFASIARIGGKIYYFFYTTFVNGEVLLTANGYFTAVNAEGCSVQTLPKADVRQVLEAHEKRLEEFLTKGYQPVAAYTPETRLGAARQFYAHAAVQRSLRLSFLKSFAVNGVLLFVVSLTVVIALIAGASYLIRSQPGTVIYRTPVVSATRPVLPSPAVTLSPAGTMAAAPSFTASFVQVHHCQGASKLPWVTFRVTNISDMTFTALVVSVQDIGRKVYLFGDPEYPRFDQGFHEGPEQCGLGEKPSLLPGESAYLSRVLDVQRCQSGCSAHTQITLCSDATPTGVCTTQEVDFTISSDD